MDTKRLFELVTMSKRKRLPANGASELRQAFDLGPARSRLQDVEFGVLQTMVIAPKAISPAANDPATAIRCVEQRSRIMIRCAAREQAECVPYGMGGVLRVYTPRIDFDRLLRSAFEQIRMYSENGGRGELAASGAALPGYPDLRPSVADSIKAKMRIRKYIPSQLLAQIPLINPKFIFDLNAEFQ